MLKVCHHEEAAGAENEPALHKPHPPAAEARERSGCHGVTNGYTSDAS